METYDDLSIAIQALIESKSLIYGQEIYNWVEQMQLMGANRDTIYAIMLADLEDGGRLFGPTKNGIKNAIKDALGMANNMASQQAYANAGLKLFKWVTASKGKSCPDCASRAGRVETLELWNSVGRPQSGFSICRQHCNCKLVASDYQGDTTIESRNL